MCDRVAFPGGGFAIVCGVRHRRPPPCVYCGKPSAYECDGPPRSTPGARMHSVTCDRPLCRTCRIHVPPNRDFCREHRAAATAAAAQLRLFHDEVS